MKTKLRRSLCMHPRSRRRIVSVERVEWANGVRTHVSYVCGGCAKPATDTINGRFYKGEIESAWGVVS